MNNTNLDIEIFNKNKYVLLLSYLFEHINDVEEFLSTISKNRDFRSIDDLVLIYEKIFTNNESIELIEFKIKKIHKALYLVNPECYTKGNSYFHLTLFLSSQVDWLDRLYNGILSRMIKLYKHLFSKIDNYFITLDIEQVEKYHNVLLSIKKEVSKFIEFNTYRNLLERRDKLKPEYLKKIPFGGLFYVTDLENVESILKNGILSHNNAHNKGLVSVDISNNNVNDKRNRLEPSLGGNIHDFAPLFINHRNATFYYWCKNRDKNNLILFSVNPHILLIDDVFFSDGNAAVKTTRFYRDISDFNCLNWEIIHSDYWTNYQDGKRIKCSEVLIKDKIPLYYIDNIYVYSEETLKKIMQFFPNHFGIHLSINKSLYF